MLTFDTIVQIGCPPLLASVVPNSFTKINSGSPYVCSPQWSYFFNARHLPTPAIVEALADQRTILWTMAQDITRCSITLGGWSYVIKCPHFSHHPTIRYMVYNGYYKVMSNSPKSWDIYQSLMVLAKCLRIHVSVAVPCPTTRIISHEPCVVLLSHSQDNRHSLWRGGE